ncbi:ammonium transporter [Botrimarina sp.]|uniref:ammonium transporter n=1 Tax=Botrimarina sp. TaxID=2795802 RepID=UPI0032ECF6F2
MVRLRLLPIAILGLLACPCLAQPAGAAGGAAESVDLRSLVDQSWVLMAAGLVLLMQAGFLCLESGLSRAKNGIHVAMKNLADFCLSVTLYWLFGYALMFGASSAGWFGADHFALGAGASAWTLTFFLFQATFCGTATTIVSGAVAERMRFSSYLLVATLVSGVIYPLFGHWAWGGVVPGSGAGWLASLGFIDFAGSTVVHSIGGWVALAAVLVIGPRTGRFGDDAAPMNGHNLPLAMLGALILWFGWFGFNGGSTLSVGGAVPLILVNTCLSAAAGGVFGIACSWAFLKRVNAMDAINGVIAGLVGITACCHLLSPAAAVLVGATSSALCYGGIRLLERLRLDDTIGAVSAHGAAGAWGTLCVALLAPAGSWGTGHDRWTQLAVQAAGVGVAFVWAFGSALVVLYLVNRVLPLRVSAEAERQGLNVAEHGASTEVLDLLTAMQRQEISGDFSRSVDVEPHTEVGQIAAGYNRVLEKFNNETELLKHAKSETETLSAKLVDAAHRAGKAEIATDVLHNVGNVLNSVNVSAGLVMERLDSKHAQRIAQTADLIAAHVAEPGPFFAEGGRGAAVPGFLRQLAEGLESDLTEATRELRDVIDRLDHIKAIVATQQDHAGMSGMKEPVDLPTLIEQAETLNSSSFDRHGVRVVRDYEPGLPEVLVEKQKLLQIVVNLLRNSKEALVAGRTEGRRMTITLRRHGDDDVLIRVADNGVGIARENLAKIFNHGFTTKHDGHGFGLHSCANAATEMGGSLSGESDGPGRGATFSLILPLQPQEALA